MEFVPGPTAMNFVCLASAPAMLCPLVNEWGLGRGSSRHQDPGPPLLHQVGDLPFPCSGLTGSTWVARCFTLLLRRVGHRKESGGLPSRDEGRPSEDSCADAGSHLPSAAPPSWSPWGPSESRGGRSIHPFICRSLTHSLTHWATEYTGEQDRPRVCPQGAS